MTGGFSRHRLALVATALAFALSAQAAAAHVPRSGGHFRVHTSHYTLGQAPVWQTDHKVVYHDNSDGQIYRSRLRGKHKRCLTCGMDDPNNVPVVQPHGKWILFHSWQGKNVHAGAPGFGGIGSDIWVMRRNGGHRTSLTPDMEGHDNFHAYWSPNGRWIEWTALNWNFITETGDGKSQVMLGRFRAGKKGPRLTNVHSVRPPNGHWYETQWWAPDGSGFLYTESHGTSINNELYFCRLAHRAKGVCKPQRLTNDPAWDEQAVFTPDMRRIIFMSTRDHPGAFNDFEQQAQTLGLPPGFDYALILPIFEFGFLQPVFEQSNDLYQLRWNRHRARPMRRRPVKRLTRDGNKRWVTPEFAWSPNGKRLLWTELRFRKGVGLPQDFTLLHQVKNLIHLLLNPPTGGTNNGGVGTENLLEERTRIARYKHPHHHHRH